MTTTNGKLKGNGKKPATQSVQPSLPLLPLIMDNVPQAVFWKDRDLVYLGCNQAFAEDAGLSSPEEIIGKTDYDMPWKDQAELYRADDCLVMEKGEPKLNYEEPQTTPSGSIIWLRTSKIPVREAGKIVAVLGMYEDITEYKTATEATKVEKQRFQTILETMRIPTIISRLSDGVVLYANQAIAEVSQVHLEKLIGFKTGSFYANPDSRKTVLESLQKYGHINDFEVQFRRTDGSTYWALLSSRVIEYEGQRCVLSTYIDITERKQAEAATREANARVQAVLDAATQIAIIATDPNGLLTVFNPGAQQMLGYLAEEMVGKQTPALIHVEAEVAARGKELSEEFGRPIQGFDVFVEYARQGRFEEQEWTYVRKDGTHLTVSLVVTAVRDSKGEITGFLGIARDITERRQAEAAIHESEERFRRFTEATSEGLVFHEQGRIVDANPAGLAMFGLSDNAEFIGRNLLEFVVPEFHRLIVEKMQQDDVPPYEVQCIRADHSIFAVETSTRTYKHGDRIIRATSIRDITERKQAEQALSDSEARYSAVVTQAQDGIVIIQDNVLQFVNEAMANMLGYTPSELVDTPIINYIALESRELIVNRIKARLAGQEVPTVYEAKLQSKNGTLIDAELSAGVIEYRGRPADVGMIRDITERKRVEKAQETQREFSEKQSYVFADLARSEKLYGGDIQAAFAEVTQAAAKTLNIQRASIWYYNEAHTEIRCMDLFEQGKGHSEGIVLTKADFPAYFKALEDERVIAADNAHTNPATHEFSASYLTPLGINSMLDAPIRLRGKVIGVICNEHVGPFHQWTMEEQNFARLIVDFVTVAVETQERKQAEEFLRQSEAKLSSALHVAQMGLWEFDIATQMFTFNDQYYSLHGRTAQEVGGYQMSVQRFAQEFVYPEDGPIVGQATQQAIETTDPDFHVQVEARIMHADGKPRWVTVWFRIEKDAQGRTVKLHGVNQDITARKNLEQEIQTALERRGLQVQLSTRVSQSIAAAASLEELYERVVTQVKEQFDYYHTQILRYDAIQEAVVLVTGYGETGAKMLAAGHRLPMGEGLIGTAAATGETVLRPVLEKDPDWHPNPLLPETKGEIAVPIKLGDTVLGVLDVQSSAAGALDADDQLLLEGLCGQVATAIEDTRLRQEMSERLEEINRLYRAMSHEGWQTYRQTADMPSGFMFDQAGLRPVTDPGLAEELFARVPLTVPGGEVVGMLSIADDQDRPITPEEEGFLQQVSEQLALALESARLFEQTQQQRGQLNEALDIAKLANWEYDVNRDRFIFNDHFYSIFHTTVEQVGGYEISSAEYAERFVYPDDRPMVGGEIGKALSSTDRHYNVQLEHRILFADGGVGYISVNVHIERDEQGQITRYYGANQDITERKRAEVVIQESRAALGEAMDIAKLANWEYDVNRDRFIFNDHFYSIFHTTVEQVGGYEISSAEYAERFVHPDDRPMVGGEIGKALSSTDRHYNVQLEHRILFADGGVGYISVNVHIERDEQGRITRYYGANQDITERKLAEEAIAKRAAELATVAQVSTTTSTVLDPDQLLQSVVNLTKERFDLYHAHIYLVNPERTELVLTAGAGEIGRRMLAEGWAIPADHELSIIADAYRRRQSVIANDVHHDQESTFLSNRLLPNTRSEVALPLFVGDQVLGVFDVQSDQVNYFTSEDVNIYTTLASQVAVALQNARLYVEQAALVTQLRELDKLKSSFLANMSHELRTPLNSILGFADVIIEELDGPLTENMNNDLRLIQKNGQHLLHLINDVLDMAKIEAGRMNLNPETFTACEVLEEVTSITSTLASEKNLSLFIQDEADKDVKIYADRTRLRQVMINLVNNAIKFTETGNIALNIASIPGARILISVKDTGIGISADKLEPIFQEFTQVDASSTRKAGGTGLGLPISRKLVEMHGGRLWAESTGIPGEGSTFFVELPVEARITETIEKQVK